MISLSHHLQAFILKWTTEAERQILEGVVQSQNVKSIIHTLLWTEPFFDKMTS